MRTFYARFRTGRQKFNCQRGIGHSVRRSILEDGWRETPRWMSTPAAEVGAMVNKRSVP
jgi:hypothetical protein